MRLLSFFALLILATPLVVLAQTPTTFAELVSLVIDIINPLFALIIGAILLMFLFGLAKFIFSLGSTDSIEQGKQLMFWGIIALFVALSFWGLVAILSNTFLMGTP